MPWFKSTSALDQHLKRKLPLVGRLVYLFVLAALSALLMVLYIDPLPLAVREGAIAVQNVTADQNYELTDHRSTQRLKEEAARSVLPVYDFDTQLQVRQADLIAQSFAAARQKLADAKLATKKFDPAAEDEIKLRQDFQVSLGIALNDSDYRLVREAQFSEDIEKVLLAFLNPIQRHPIVADKNEMLQHGSGVALREYFEMPEREDVHEAREIIVRENGQIYDLKEAQEIYAKKAVDELIRQLNLDFIDADRVKLALKLYPLFLRENVMPNKAETTIRREKARQSVQNVTFKLQKGQTIIRKGDSFDAWHVMAIGELRAARQQTSLALKFFGMFGLGLVCLFFLYHFASSYIKKFTHNQKDLYFLGLMLVGFIGFLRLASFMAGNLQDSVPYVDDITVFYYLIPMAAAAMLVRFILNSETALVFAIVMSIFSGLFLQNNMELSIYYLIGGIVGAHLVGRVERRSTVFRCGLYLGFVNALVVLCTNLVEVSTATVIDYQSLFVSLAFAFLGGISSSLMMLAISPFFETLFNYTTNIQLLELANMNHPLMREMIVRAPGTYHHSQLVGILAEAGAQAIGARALLARVGSYYHDIGKMKKPLYFIENQKGFNPHDALAPSMSALIIDAHVKDGIDMAREYKLPEVITDFIPEHQGTKLIGYFFNKAKKMAGPHDVVEEKDYRYKGPKPQTRESGIIMLSDTIEAAVRSMAEKSPQKIQATVEKLVNMHFADGQLDECDLTLRDLHILVEAFVKILVGIYHQRVEYPEQKPASPIKVLKADEEDTNSHPDLQPPHTPSNISPLFKK